MNQLTEYRLRLLDQLAAQPGQAAALVAALPVEAHQSWRDPDGLNVHQLLAHIRDLEAQAIWPRLGRILDEDEPHLAPFDSHHWSLAGQDPAEPAVAIVADMTRTRLEALARLRPLAPGEWARRGFHPPSGWRTAQWWAERLYAHAQDHLDQLRGALTETRRHP